MAMSDKAKLYKKVVAQADEYTIVERMRMLGFWSEHLEIPEDPVDEDEERRELEYKINELRKQSTATVDPQKALQKERIRRWQESKLRRAAAKAKREKQQAQRRAEWQAEKSSTIVFSGEGVSAGLQGTASDEALLSANDLPIIHTAAQLAQEIGIELTTLRWLTYHRKGAPIVHYHRYEIPKKTGGIRQISAPKPELAAAQRWVLNSLLDHQEISDRAHGFVTGRSILSGALPHAKKAVVINIDLKDFFPSITFRRVKGLFVKMGYSEQVATVLGLLCTEPPRVEVTLDEKPFAIALGERQLPQGACTSPAITNLICRRLDRRIGGLCQSLGFSYTRYADDFSFSGENRRSVGKLLKIARHIVEAEGFTVNEKKTKVMHRGRRQEVTGLTVNEQPKVSRRERRALRALLNNCARHGLESQNRQSLPFYAEHLKGRVAYMTMVDPENAVMWRTALEKALAKR